MTDNQKPNILLITTDQQRFDSLGCNGNTVCPTPAVDALAASGIAYERAHTQNVLCTPSRSTIITGQHPGTHGVWCNGVALPAGAPTVAGVLGDAGYRTALVGKLHFEPLVTLEPALSTAASVGPHRGFDHVEFGDHFPDHGHYGKWLQDQLGEIGHRRWVRQVEECLQGTGGDTGAPQAMYSPLPAELHTSTWIVDRALDWLDTGSPSDPFFAWVSFDDPHHPFKPPAAYGRRHDWRDLPLPSARPTTAAAIQSDLDAKPWPYGAYWRGDHRFHEGSLGTCPGTVTDDQIRELTALTYGMIELVDEQVGRLLAELERRGLRENTHVFFSTDHGELLGDHGLLLKGPFHLDGLLHVPLIWSPPPGAKPVRVSDPVGLVDLAPTFCAVAGLEVPEWMDGEPLPEADGSREHVLTVFDSSYRPELKLRTIYRDGLLLTAYPGFEDMGELYDHGDDPNEFVNRWADRDRRGQRDELLAVLAAALPAPTDADRLPHVAHA